MGNRLPDRSTSGTGNSEADFLGVISITDPARASARRGERRGGRLPAQVHGNTFQSYDAAPRGMWLDGVQEPSGVYSS
jgi:hypothetical protein